MTFSDDHDPEKDPGQRPFLDQDPSQLEPVTEATAQAAFEAAREALAVAAALKRLEMATTILRPAVVNTPKGELLQVLLGDPLLKTVATYGQGQGPHLVYRETDDASPLIGSLKDWDAEIYDYARVWATTPALTGSKIEIDTSRRILNRPLPNPANTMLYTAWGTFGENGIQEREIAIERDMVTAWRKDHEIGAGVAPTEESWQRLTEAEGRALNNDFAEFKRRLTENLAGIRASMDEAEPTLIDWDRYLTDRDPPPDAPV